MTSSWWLGQQIVKPVQYRNNCRCPTLRNITGHTLRVSYWWNVIYIIDRNIALVGKRIAIFTRIDIRGLYCFISQSSQLTTIQGAIFSPYVTSIVRIWCICECVYITTHHPTPANVDMHQWIESVLAQIIACRLFGVKPLSEPMSGYCQLDPKEQTSVEF